MKDFEAFFKELISDEIWAEQASMHHKPETFKSVANKVYVNGITDSQAFFLCPMSHHRQHVFNKLSKLTPDKVKKAWWDKPKEEVKPDWVPVSWEERSKRLKEFQEMVDNSPLMKPVAKPSARELIENGDWRPKPEAIREPSEEEKIKAAQEYTKKMQIARTKMFREKYPNGNVKELRKYLQKWKHIDNPFNL